MSEQTVTTTEGVAWYKTRSARIRFEEYWELAERRSARARGDVFREQASKLADEAKRVFMAGLDAEAAKLRVASKRLYEEADRAMPFVGRPFDPPPAPDLPELRATGDTDTRESGSMGKPRNSGV